MTKRILSLLVALVMVLGLLPVSAFATEPDTYTAQFQGHTAQLNSFKVYTYTDGVKGETDLLEGVADSDDSNTQLYTTALAAGDYWVEAYDTAGDCSGGMKITVEAKDLNEFAIYRAYMIKASNSGWVLGTDYTVSAMVQTQDKTVTREVVMGTAKDYNGNDLPAVLCLSGDTVKITYTPSEARQTENYIETFKSATMTANNSSWSVSIPQGVAVTFQVPNGSVVDAGRFHDYYVYDFAEPTSTSKPAEGDWSYTYMIPKSTDWFYRVQHDEGVTYWNFNRWTAETTVTITAEDLYIGSEDYDKDTIFRYDHNVYDRADIYLNINGKGHLTMAEGGTYQLNVFRNWMAIESYMNAKVALPDMHYTVIDMEGNPSDLLTIVPDEHNSSVALMTANGEGTAIVLVTYDAMTHMVGQTSTGSDRRFSAIWPECTGVFVVTVGGENAEIETNMMIERYEAADTAIDAEHDILFYLGDAGASYSFAPESGCTVTVNRAVISDNTLTYEGFTSEGVTVAEDGTVTVNGLTSGRHIVKIEKDGKAVYQIITARGVACELQDADGKALTEVKAGDTVYLQFHDLVNPAEKLSGAYNFNASIYYVGEDETAYRSNPGSNFGVYDFSGNPVRQKIAITIPKYWSGSSYTLNGAIKMGGFGNVSVGGHRGVTYANGLNPNFNASTVGMILSRMPRLTIALAETTFLTGTMTFVDTDGNAVSGLTVSMADAEGNAVTVNSDGTFKCLPGDYTYSVYGAGYLYSSGTVTVTEDGENTFTVTLTAATEGTWDGITETEPSADEEGVYQITNGAELAWFVNKAGSAHVSGILVNDIDLGCYPWSYPGSTSYTLVLDGNGKTVTNLNAAQALIAKVGSESNIHDLSVSGAVNATVNYAAGIVGQLSGISTIANCESNVTVTSTADYVGGIVGTISGTGIVSGCVNRGSVTGRNYVGGIFGYSGYAVTISDCYNTAPVSGNNNVGGVGGYFTGPWRGMAILTDAYNTGAVTATNTSVGGVLGSYGTSNTTVSHLYYLEGAASSDAAATVLTSAELKSAELDLTAWGYTCDGYPALMWENAGFHVKPDAGSVVAPTCTVSGYTAYVCASCGETFKAEFTASLGHDWCDCAAENPDCADCVYTAPTCTGEGSIVHTCRREGCEETHTDVLAALGHDWCDCEGENPDCTDCTYTAPTCTEEGSIVHTCRREGCEEVHTDIIPATGHTAGETVAQGLGWTDSICTACDVTFRIYDHAILEDVTLDEAAVSAISVTDGDYPWGYDAANDRITSGNKGINSSTSASTIELTLTHTAAVSFRYGASSEINYDKLTITATLADGTEATIASGVSGVTEAVFSQTLPAGSYSITFSYTKDSSAGQNEDLAWVRDLTVTATCQDDSDHVYVDTVVEPACGAEGYTQHDCSICGYNFRDNFTAALAHEYESVVTAPDYGVEGFTTHTCVLCGHSYVDSITPALELAKVHVYLSISYDDQFSVGGETDEVVALRDIEIPYFDLALYGLEEFYFCSEEYGSGSGEIGDNTFVGQEPYENKVTMLHLYIYATEVFYFGLDEDEAGKGWLYEEGLIGTGVLDIGGSVGSLFLNDFWYGSMNLNYYRNYEYPLASSGWGATADQILLHDGDIVTLGAFTSWNFFGDSSSIFNYIVADGDTVTTEAVQGESLSLQVMHAGANMGTSDGTAQTPVTSQPDVYMIPVSELSSGNVTEWNYIGTANENGQLTISTAELAPGEYIVAVSGQYGAEFTDEICSTPGGIRLTVVPCTEHTYTETVVAPTCTSIGYTIHTCACGHSFVDGIVDAIGHNYESVVTEPTHDKMGYTTHTCANCGHEYVDSYVDALEHSYTQTVTSEPTCTSEGVMTFTCECGESYTEVIPMTAHTYTETVVAPTCTAIGYTMYTCECGHSYIATISEATGHTETVVGQVDAHYHTDGYTGDTVCAVCGVILVKGEIIPAVCPSQGYSDVPVGTWYHEAVDYVTDKGLMNGMGGDIFAPAATTNRAMLAVLLYRMAGEPSVEGMENPFGDVPASSWFHDAVVWAFHAGIVNGKSAAIFAPADDVTREQMVTMLYRYVGSPEVDLEVLSSYTDADTVSRYARKAFAWAIENGIVTGVTETVLSPTANANRAQIAVILMRYLEK